MKKLARLIKLASFERRPSLDLSLRQARIILLNREKSRQTEPSPIANYRVSAAQFGKLIKGCDDEKTYRSANGYNSDCLQRAEHNGQ